MITYKLLTPSGQVTVSLNVASAQASAKLSYEGSDEAIAQVSDWLEWEYGAFGHLIGDRTTPVDLHAAMSSDRASRYSPELVEGAELVEDYDPGIPGDVVT